MRTSYNLCAGGFQKWLCILRSSFLISHIRLDGLLLDTCFADKMNSYRVNITFSTFNTESLCPLFLMIGIIHPLSLHFTKFCTLSATSFSLSNMSIAKRNDTSALTTSCVSSINDSLGVGMGIYIDPWLVLDHLRTEEQLCMVLGLDSSLFPCSMLALELAR